MLPKLCQPLLTGDCIFRAHGIGQKEFCSHFGKTKRKNSSVHLKQENPYQKYHWQTESICHHELSLYTDPRIKVLSCLTISA